MCVRVYRELHDMTDGGVVGARVAVDPLEPHHQLPQHTPNLTTVHLRVTSYELRVRGQGRSLMSLMPQLRLSTLMPLMLSCL